MDNLVTHIFTASNHPIKRVAREKQEVYLAGMGALLYDVSNGDVNVELLYDALCFSIIGECGSTKWFNKRGLNAISRAITTERKWWKPWSIQKTFFFDCFYILEAIDCELRNKANQKLKDFCSTFGKKQLSECFRAFFEHSLANIKQLDAELIGLYDNNQKFNEKILFTVLVVANVSAGKSTLINALTGKNIVKSGNLACTQRLCRLYNKPTKDLILYKKDRYHFVKEFDKILSIEVEEISFPFSSLLGSERICFIDTPGVNNSQTEIHKEVTTKAIEDNGYDLLLYVLNAKYIGTTDEQTLLEYVHMHCRKPIIFVLNQLDNYDEESDEIVESLNDVKKDIENVGIKNPIIVPISAKAALAIKTGNDTLSKYYAKLFDNPYYDMPHYFTTGFNSKSLIEKTGINILEEIIIKILNQ